MNSVSSFCNANSRKNARVVMLFGSFPTWVFKATVSVQQYPMLGLTAGNYTSRLFLLRKLYIGQLYSIASM